MNDLLALAVDAHGGLQQWNKFQKVTVHMLVKGALWPAKGQDGVISDSWFESELRRQATRYIDFQKPGQEAIFQPGKVAIIDHGSPVEELSNPRASFEGHVFGTPWSRLQLVYFGSYAMWAYLGIPFLFTLPGFESKEIAPWHEGGETWRRLHVSFPKDFAYHTREQVFYFDEHGLLKRLDYQVDINEGVAAAHYVFDYKEFQGIRLPTRRLVYARNPDGSYAREPLVVRNDLVEVKFS